MTTFFFMTFLAALVLLPILFSNKRGAESLRIQFLDHVGLVAAQGLPLAPAIAALAEERASSVRWLGRSDARKEAALLHGIAGRLQSHGSLAEACAGARAFLAPDQVDLIRRAEQAGGLPAVLEVLRAEEAERERGTWRALEICFYPLVVSVFAVPGSLFLTEVVQPKLREIVDVLGARPLDMQAITTGVSMVYVLLLVSGLCLLLPGRPGAWLRGRAARVLSAAPLLGRPLRRWQHARWLSRVAALMQFGATLPEALGQVAGVAGSTPGQATAAELARRGHPLGEVLSAGLAAEASALVPSLTLTVDRVGSLPQGLTLAAKRLSERANRRLSALAETLRPLPIMACGLVVGLHYVGIWSSIASIQGTVIGGMW